MLARVVPLLTVYEDCDACKRSLTQESSIFQATKTCQYGPQDVKAKIWYFELSSVWYSATLLGFRAKSSNMARYVLQAW